MRKMRFTGLVGLVVMTLVIAACGGDTTETTTAEGAGCGVDELELVQPGVLTIATGEPAFPPWVIDDDPTNQQGFEAAVAYAVATQLGFTPEQVTWIRTGFDEAVAPGPKEFDFNLQQYSITEERDEVVDFSIPYYVTDQALVAFADSPVTAANAVGDLKGFNLGAQIGTTSLDYIEEVIQPDTPPAVYDTNADAKSGLDAGQVDALVFDLPTAFFITAVEMPDTTIVGVLEASEEQADRFGLLFADGSPLVDCVNGALEALEAAGTLDALAEQWLASEGEIKTITR
jgi:polar amino acid transport system substrate-binding protein